MSEQPDQIKCVLLTINNEKLVLPNTAVAEIVPIRNIINVANKPVWMLGYLDWRGNSVPLVSFEALGGVHMPSLASGDVKAAVVYAIGDNKDFSYMSLLMQGAPQVVKVTATDLIATHEATQNPAVDQKLMINNEPVSLVNLEKLESVIQEVMT